MVLGICTRVYVGTLTVIGAREFAAQGKTLFFGKY